jgi:glucose/mannose-6-phosphate isomerase
VQRSKVKTLQDLFGDPGVRQNRNIEIVNVELSQKNFFQRFFFGHFFILYIAYFLGTMTDTEGRDLISTAAANPW